MLLCLWTGNGTCQEGIFVGKQRQGEAGAELSSLLLILDAAQYAGHHTPFP